MNVLETVASAWRTNIADQGIIEEEFHSLFFRPGNYHFRYELYRRETGVFPSIGAFVESVGHKGRSFEQKGRVA
jgi:hypothetical protein